MNRRIMSIAAIGMLTIGLITTPLKVDAIGYTNPTLKTQVSTNSIGYWTYVYVEGKLTRIFVYTKNENTAKTVDPVDQPSSEEIKTQVTKYPKGYWTYVYEEGKLTRKFVTTNDNKKTTTTETSPADTTKEVNNSPTKDPTVSENQNINNDNALTKDEMQLYTLINEERSKAGLSPVQIDMDVVKAARLKSEDMANNHYFAHKSPTYGDARQMLKDMNIAYLAAAENIAINGSVSRVHSSFMSSSTHKANILGSGWTHVGLGIAKQTNGYGMIVTEIFLSK